MSLRDRQLDAGPGAALSPIDEGDDQETAPASGHALFVIPTKRGDGFRASIRGHTLELADPDSGHGLAPTPKDLLIAALASDIAWFARRLLRDHGLDDYVSVSARAQSSESVSGLGGVAVTVEVSGHAAAMGATLAAALERRVAAQSSLPPRLLVRQA